MRSVLLILATAVVWPAMVQPAGIPEFKRGTVLVWKSENRGHESSFIIRVARFQPSRYFEWENQTTQGTVLLGKGSVERSRRYTSFRLFQAGADLESNDEISYWLSQKVFEELKTGGKASIQLDAVKTELVVVREGTFELRVNQEAMTVGVLEARDGRGGLWAILDEPANPLVVRRKLGTFVETLSSVTTNRADTLRWIKGARLGSERLPR